MECERAGFRTSLRSWPPWRLCVRSVPFLCAWLPWRLCVRCFLSLLFSSRLGPHKRPSGERQVTLRVTWLGTLNIAPALKEATKGGPCHVFMADIRLRVQRTQAYYYPDVVVTCDPADRDE